jgi:hypothetical protein
MAGGRYQLQRLMYTVACLWWMILVPPPPADSRHAGDCLACWHSSHARWLPLLLPAWANHHGGRRLEASRLKPSVSGQQLAGLQGLVHCPEEMSVPVVVNHLPCHCTTTLWLLCKAVTGCRQYPGQHMWHASQPCSDSLATASSGYRCSLSRPCLDALKRHRCHGGRRLLAASTLKSYVSSALAALKHTKMLRTRPEYRKARRAWVHAFKPLRNQVDAHYRRCASGEALPNRCQGYVPWGDLCRVRDQLAWGSIERLLLELHTHALGRSREYASVRLFREVPSKEQRHRHPNYCVLHPSGPAGSYLRLGSFKTSGYIGPHKLPLNASLHRAIMTSRAEAAAAAVSL